MNLKLKLISSFFGIGLLLAAVGGVTIYYLQEIKSGAYNVASSNVGEVRGSAGLSYLLVKINGNLADYLLNINTRHEEEAARYKESLIEEMALLRETVSMLQSSTEKGVDIADDDEEEQDELEEKENILRLAQTIAKFEQLVKATISRQEISGIQSAIDFYSENKAYTESSVITGSNVLYHDAIDEIEEESEEVIETVRKATNLIITFTVLALLVSLFIGIFMSNHITTRILKLKNAAKDIQKGNYDVQVKDGGEKDEIASLVWSFNHMARQLASSTVSIGDLEYRVSERTQQLENAKSEAENASRAKSDFLANMSHELRTPLNHIIGFTELIADEKFGTLNKLQKEYLGDSLSSSKHLLVLINDILDLSKVEAGKLELHVSQVNIENLIQKSMIMFKEKAMKHNLELVEDTEGLPENVEIDEIKVKQVLYNLVSNAVKFTPDGGRICLKAKLARGGNIESMDHQPMLYISVIDSGIGISEDDLSRIFKPFEQVISPEAIDQSGTGLGLSLTKKFVELHGGEIYAHSEGRDMGSTFTLTLPIGPGAGEEKK